MATHLPENQTSSLTDTQPEVEQETVRVVDDSGDRLSLIDISARTGLSVSLVRKYLYRGIINSTLKRDVLAWINHRNSASHLTGQSRIHHSRVFNKWR